HFLEMICCQLGDFDDAIIYLKKEIGLKPSNADAYHKLGTVLLAKGLFSESIKYFRKAVTLKPVFPDAYYNLGVALQNTGQPDGAILNYQKAVQIGPGQVEAYNNLGILLTAKGHPEEAITYFQKAIRINPNYADIYNNLGLALKDKGDIDEAIINYKKAINLNPAFADAYYNLGFALHGKKQLDEAINLYKKALQINPDLAEVQNNLGNILAEKGQLDEAITYFQKAIALNPNFADAYYNLGFSLHINKCFDDAIKCYQKAIELNPAHIDAYNNLGAILKDKGQLNDAITCYDKALKIDPCHAGVHFNLGLVYLLSGNFKEGWKEYEWRWRTTDFISYQRNFSKPLWDNSDISEKTILIYTEQGLGDAIHFIRYAPLVVKQGARVIIECQRQLVSLFENIEGIHQMVVRDEQLPEFDVHCPLLSLPSVFGTTIDTIPAEIPYIMMDSLLVQKWKDRVKDDNSKFRAGLAWAGNPLKKGDSNRSFPLETFAPLAESDGVIFYSLQKGNWSEQAQNPPEGMTLVDYTDEINDFSDTAALIENLDLVISVDTAVAHLAGALAKPVWTLLPFAPDWRWMLNREDSPWYPTMRLFRQPSPGDWESVMEKLKEELITSVMSKINKPFHST
ncbi:MAG TPA: hypothetical protein DDW27_13815, partial [Bacteroidales bacterium]|nr:hypothetical protein [Bacteroidales bacterium]